MARSTGIAYVDGPRLRRSLLAAADWVAAGRDELNRLNVFPVPDGDTGTNLSLTLREVAQALHDLGDAPLPRVAKRWRAPACAEPAATPGCCCRSSCSGCATAWATA